MPRESSGQDGSAETTCERQRFSQSIVVNQNEPLEQMSLKNLASNTKRHPHESPSDYVQSFQWWPVVQKGFQSQPALEKHPGEAWIFPGLPSQAEASFHGHRVGGWLQHKAPLGGAGSCSTYTWRTSPLKRQRFFNETFNNSIFQH